MISSEPSPIDPAAFNAGNSRKIPFSVASALLRELGERLVSRPHIALGELIKNSYDADASKVTITIAGDRIEVTDNGHGMTPTEFNGYWMRVGSPHKESERYSRGLRRPMTGSKGVGRLAAQFLARTQVIATVSDKHPSRELLALVNWNEAIAAGDLTEAVALYREISPSTAFPDGSEHGTSVVLTDLNQDWSVETVKALARDIWWLQPPFRSNPRLKEDRQRDFQVELKTEDPALSEVFERHMRAIMDIWHARIQGRLTTPDGKPPVIQLSLEFAGEGQIRHDFTPAGGPLSSLEFEIRLFHLKRRQPQGISVHEAREYMNKFGGVRVYDGGFHLPYYGRPETDWLETEISHSHRLSRSGLLPEELQVPDGLTYLPTLSRMIGVVHVDTALEHEVATRANGAKAIDYLQIQVTRDRLVDNSAYQTLKDAVRYALDLYAMHEAKRAFEETEAVREVEPLTRKLERVDEILEGVAAKIDKSVFQEVRRNIREAIKTSESEAEATLSQLALLGPLATAGITALATLHETGQQVGMLEGATKQLRALKPADFHTREALGQIIATMELWTSRFKASRALFSHLLDNEARESPTRVRARPFFDDLLVHLEPLRRATTLDAKRVERELRLPIGTVAEWTAVFQNVLLNALNATLDTERKRISISSGIEGRRTRILVQDTGVGVELDDAEQLFRPFERRLELSKERRSLGLGGSGLGLTIVRLIATQLACKVRFVKPEADFETAFELSWRET